MIFYVLGPLEVRAGERIELGAAKPVALLVTLLSQANHWVSAERLVDAIWPEHDTPPSADRNLKTYVWRLRKLLPDRVRSRPGAYRIDVAEGELDTDVFTALAGEADQLLAQGEPESAARTYAAAVALWRGTPFEEIRTDHAAAAETRLTELRRHVRESLAAALLTLDRRAEAITLLRMLTSEDPLREHTWSTLVLALHADGRRAEALACYRQARSTLVSELGVEPDAELARAQQLVLAGAAEVTEAPDTLPRDLPDFAGRSAESASILAAAQPDQRTTPVVLITGMGGVGKTSLAVHAAHRLGPAYPDGRLFLGLREHGHTLEVGEALRRLLVAIGTPPAGVPDGLSDRIARWRAAVADRRILLVLDDAEDAASVLPLLPGGSSCGVLITSRAGLPGLDGALVVPLDLPADAEAAALFVAMAGTRAAREPQAVHAVVRACGNLPLAIRAAATKFQYRPLWTVEELLAELDRSDHGVAFERLPRQHRRLLDVLAAVPGYVDAAAVAGLLHVERTEAARMLTHLADQHLLTEATPGRYRPHPFVRDRAVTVLRGVS